MMMMIIIKCITGVFKLIELMRKVQKETAIAIERLGKQVKKRT